MPFEMMKALSSSVTLFQAMLSILKTDIKSFQTFEKILDAVDSAMKNQLSKSWKSESKHNFIKKRINFWNKDKLFNSVCYTYIFFIFSNITSNIFLFGKPVYYNTLLSWKKKSRPLYKWLIISEVHIVFVTDFCYLLQSYLLISLLFKSVLWQASTNRFWDWISVSISELFFSWLIVVSIERETFPFPPPVKPLAFLLLKLSDVNS